ncbi:MAG: PAS domain-containing protein [Myxococcales bacterium]
MPESHVPSKQPGDDCFVALAESIDELVFVWTTDGQLLWANEVFARETGMRADDFGFDNRDNPFIHPDDLKRVLTQLDVFFNSDARRSPPIENRFIDLWGRTRHLSSIVHKITWKGEPALLFSASLQRERDGRNESDVIHQQLVEAASELILRLDPSGRIVYSTRRFQHLIGLPVVIIAKRQLQDFLEPDDRGQFENALRRVQQVDTSVSLELSLRSASEGVRRMSAKLTRLADRATPCLLVLRDVTELRRLEAALEHGDKNRPTG